MSNQELFWFNYNCFPSFFSFGWLVTTEKSYCLCSRNQVLIWKDLHGCSVIFGRSCGLGKVPLTLRKANIAPIFKRKCQSWKLQSD